MLSRAKPKTIVEEVSIGHSSFRRQRQPQLFEIELRKAAPFLLQ